MALTPQKIDDAVDALYTGKTGGGELKQLARLFSPEFAKKFEKLLKAEFQVQRGVYRREVTVELSYIDKIPVASFNPKINDIHGQQITQRTEIGDAAFFFIDKIHVNGVWRSPKARGLILQAKQATSAQLPKQVPIVPLPTEHNDSTLKELALLSAWPTFDLGFTGRSDDLFQKGYSINPMAVAVPPHGWYIGASPKTKTPWVPHWKAGPSKNGAACVETLGSLLHAVIENDGNINGAQSVGAAFTYDESRLATTEFKLAIVANPPDWSDLCHQLMLAAKAYDAPQSIFGGTGKSRTAGLGTFHTGPFAAIYEFFEQLFQKLFEPKRRFAVLTVTRISGEGTPPP